MKNTQGTHTGQAKSSAVRKKEKAKSASAVKTPKARKRVSKSDKSMSEYRRKCEEAAKLASPFCLDQESADECGNYHHANLRAHPLSCEFAWIGMWLEQETKGLIDGDSSDGLSGVEYLGLGETRLLSNEECCSLGLTILEQTQQFDIRKPLPPAIVKWLRQSADRLMKAAELIEMMTPGWEAEDTKTRKLVRRFVKEDPNVKFSNKHGLVDVTKPLPPVRW